MRVHPLRVYNASLVSLVLAAAAWAPAPSTAATLLNDGAVNQINGASPDIEVQNGPGDASTTVNVVAGADLQAAPNGDPNEGRSIGLTQDSVLQFSAGSTAGDVHALDASTAFISGDAVVGGNLVVGGGAVVEVSSNAVVDGKLLVSGGGAVSMLGGIVDDLEAEGNAVVTFANPARVDDDAFFTGSSRLVASGGRFDDELQFFDNTTALFTGGVVNDDLVVAGDAQVQIDFFQVDDTIEASGASRTTISGGLISNVEAAGASLVEISGGTFAAGGGAIGSFGGLLKATGGVFGTAGGADTIEIPSVAGGRVEIEGVEIAGAAAGTAPPVEVSNSLNGGVVLKNMQLGDLGLTTITGASTELVGLTVEDLVVNLQAGKAVIDIVHADSLDATADLGGELRLIGGDFDTASLRSLGGSTIEIYGSDFVLNGFIQIDPTSLPFEVPLGSGSIAANLADGSPFAANFARSFSAGTKIMLVDGATIPEPTALSLVAFGLAVGAPRRGGR